MKLNLSTSGNSVTVTLADKMYVKEATELREKLLVYIDSGYKELHIDMSGVEYIDSSGLGVLVALHKRTLQIGGRVILHGLKGSVKELFELTRLTKVFDIV